MDAEVLIAGAGPTGLVLALWLARLGIRIRIIDKTAEPGTTSRALALQARTLELYRQLGIAREVVDAGLVFSAANLWARGRRAAHIELGTLGVGRSPFPYGLIYPQDEHERFLIERLRELNVRVERKTELVDFEEGDGRVVARLGTSTCETPFLAACDGARSTVREKLGIGFPGGTYEHLFYVADVDASGPLMDRELHVSIDESDFLAVFPLKKEGRARLIGTIRPEAGGEGKELGWGDVSKGILQRLRIDVRRVNWFSTYQVHHRVATRFRQGRVFLLGDAAHIHSPVGGQGMNTGIGDAVNLAWKLAAALRGRAPERILDSYEPERIRFARRLVATTDRVFQFVTRSGRLAARVRVHLAPRVISAAFLLPAVRRFFFRTISQTGIEYRGSDLSEGRAGRVQGGDRLPWVQSEPDNFTPLESLDWQVHVHGAATRELAASCASRGLQLHVFPWSRNAARAGLVRDASYLVRPDGHVALADRLHSPARLERYLEGRGLRFGEETRAWPPASSRFRVPG
ncbi:MAG: FAD-dependent oxidoreductase [Deltaproteobacteria bacterium]|nr:MAG: FAD-dependent oxidoreductase [Deltaproteobacteria bacterium]